jgi:hypothetical protein
VILINFEKNPKVHLKIYLKCFQNKRKGYFLSLSSLLLILARAAFLGPFRPSWPACFRSRAKAAAQQLPTPDQPGLACFLFFRRPLAPLPFGP